MFNVIIMDFTKAFDKVPHQRFFAKLRTMVYKVKHYSESNHFSSEENKQVVVDGEEAEFVDILSGVLQGTVLDLVLFLLFIYDLPDGLLSSVRLFADDSVLYRPH